MSEAPETVLGLPLMTVRQLNTRVKGSLEERFGLVAVAGEVADLARPRSGHVYFTLRDPDAQIRAVMWRGTAARLGAPLADGMKIVVVGALTLYPPRGTYQIIVSEAIPRGAGEMRKALEALRRKLAAEGLFDPERKRPLPFLPFTLAVITSATGAAVQDILRTALSRCPRLVIRVLPVRVQGTEAPAEIVRALERANRPGVADVILLGRGGGSLEDLWAFNREEVVRAVAASREPVVSCVGHETDTTLTDLAADVRASTPTRAAELAVPVLSEITERLAGLCARGRRAVVRRWETASGRVQVAGARPGLKDPALRVRELSQRLDELVARLDGALCDRLRGAYNDLDLHMSRLRSLSPRATLQRGFAVVRHPGGRVVRSAGELACGTEVEIILGDGECRARVTEKVKVQRGEA